ncbi:helix-turn-helix transcriptional regulator [Profundibacter sp.]
MSVRRQAKALSDWISRADLAQELGVTTGTLARWATERTGPPLVRVGRRVFYRRSAVRKWLIERERKTGNG